MTSGRRIAASTTTTAPGRERAVERTRRLASPGDSLFVGPQDLRRTNYGPTYMYFLLRELRPASYYMEMNPGTANREGSGLADELRRADWLILTSEWDAGTSRTTRRSSARGAERGRARRLLPSARTWPVPPLRALRPSGVKSALVTGSSGLIGSELVGLSTAWAGACTASTTTCAGSSSGRTGHDPNLRRLQEVTSSFQHHDVDVRDRARVASLVGDTRPDLIVTARLSRRTTSRRAGRSTTSTSTRSARSTFWSRFGESCRSRPSCSSRRTRSTAMRRTSSSPLRQPCSKAQRSLEFQEIKALHRPSGTNGWYKCPWCGSSDADAFEAGRPCNAPPDTQPQPLRRPVAPFATELSL